MNNDADLTEWRKTVYWLANEVGEKADCKVEVNQTITRQFGFRGPMIFAYAHIRKLGAVILIETMKEWADRAGVTDTADRQTENGWFGEPNVFWHIDIEKTDRLQELVTILAGILRVRHI